MSGDPGLVAECDGVVKVGVVTGIRSEFDLLQPLLRALDDAPDFDVSVIACGAHPTPVHDHSVDLVRAEGVRVAEVIENLLVADSPTAKARTAGILLTSLAQTVAREAYDLLVVLGDREESVVTALCGTYAGVPVVHLAGGDHTHPVGGNVDEEVRHAATKLAHVHLTMAADHTERVLRLGEEPWRVHTVGSGGIDRLRVEPGVDDATLAATLGDDATGDLLVVIHHPLSSSPGTGAHEVGLVLDAALGSGLPVFVGMPNSDPGSSAIVAEIDRRVRDEPRLHPYRNLPRPEFTTLLRKARCLLGNSSLGLHEAPYLGLPVVNVGQRQRGRMAGANVQWVDPEPCAIATALHRALHDDAYRAEIADGPSPYGDGHMATRSVEVLRALPGRQALLAKDLTF